MESKYKTIYEFLKPIEHLMLDKNVNEIMINGPFDVWLRKFGSDCEKCKISINGDQIRGLITLLASTSNRIIANDEKLSRSYQIISASIPGYRFEAWNTPVSPYGPSLTIRRIASDSISLEQYLKAGTINEEIFSYLVKYINEKRNIIICGSTGSGKTTFCSSLINRIDKNERLIIIENIQEINLSLPNILYLQTDEEQGYSVDRLLISALRGLPNRIIIGELRGYEASGFLKTANTGHPGSMTTLHANSAIDAIQRLEEMIGMSEKNSTINNIKQKIANIVPIFIYLKTLKTDKNKLTKVTEIIEIENYKNSRYSINNIYTFK
jgi:pilus assembly protein CpaF